MVEAEGLLLGAFEELSGAGERGKLDVDTAALDLVLLYEAWGKADEAARWRARSPSPSGK
jgi:hypothetical protein